MPPVTVIPFPADLARRYEDIAERFPRLYVEVAGFAAAVTAADKMLEQELDAAGIADEDVEAFDQLVGADRAATCVAALIERLAKA